MISITNTEFLEKKKKEEAEEFENNLFKHVEADQRNEIFAMPPMKGNP